ncbi:MAG TPA: TIGR00180 family glycosyltransferase [Candidatus Paceibacterota bacterium]
MKTFTLLIPTYGRPALLRRLLTYYAEAHFPDRIIVADSSTRDITDENRDTTSGYPELHIIHRTFDPSIEIYQKMTEVLRSIDSDAIGLCSDDDFIAAAAPARAVRFLGQHEDYIAVQGRSFIADTSRIRIPLSAFPQRPVRSNTATDRLQSYFQDPTANFYAIYRTTVFRHTLDRIMRFRTDNTRFEELAFSCLGAIEGNIMVLNALHLVRQSSRNRVDSGSKQTGGWPHVVRSTSFPKNKQLFMEMLSEALVEHGTEKSAARRLIVDHFESYLEEKLHPSYAREPRSIQERAIAMMLSPNQGRLPLLRRGVAAITRGSPKMRALSKEYAPVAQLISQYPDGIPNPI